MLVDDTSSTSRKCSIDEAPITDNGSCASGTYIALDPMSRCEPHVELDKLSSLALEAIDVDECHCYRYCLIGPSPQTLESTYREHSRVQPLSTSLLPQRTIMKALVLNAEARTATLALPQRTPNQSPRNLSKPNRPPLRPPPPRTLGPHNRQRFRRHNLFPRRQRTRHQPPPRRQPRGRIPAGGV